MTERHKIRVKIGAHEFEAEGVRGSVEAQYDQFLRVLESMNLASPNPDQSLSAETSAPVQRMQQGGSLSRIFKVGETLSLLAIPKTDQSAADSLVLLLYGYDKLKQEESVSGLTLMKSARQSGVAVARIDRVIDARSDLYNAAGAKKGRRYSLNNRGLQFAEELIQKILS